jgi:alkyl hydroperoxide reductase subunit F
MAETYQVAILGGGPAGVAAAVYAARKQLKTVVITDSIGGQSAVSADIHNWIGTTSISGSQLADNFKAHLLAYPDVALIEKRATAIADDGKVFTITLSDGATVLAERIMLTTGARRRRLGIPGEDTFEGKGVVFCSTCDAPLFRNFEVAVVGGGNAGLEAVIDLIPYASKIYLLDRSGVLKGDAVTQAKALASEKLTRIPNVTTLSVEGEKMVSGLKYKDNVTGEEKVLPVNGVFVEIGSIPNSDLVKDLVSLNVMNEVVTDPVTQRTSHARIWAAGDITDGKHKQNNIAAGDAIKAILDMYDEAKLA